MKNETALNQFGELYKTAWTRLSQYNDDVPHFGEIVESFDRMVQTQNGRDLVSAFSQSRRASFKTDGNDLVSRRNRAAFMIALAQFKKSFPAPAPAPVPAPSPAPAAPVIEKDGRSLHIHFKPENPNCEMVVDLYQLVFSAPGKIPGIAKLIESDPRREEIVSALIRWVERNAKKDPNGKKLLVSVGAVERTKPKVKVSSKKEFFEIVVSSRSVSYRVYRSGFKIECNGFIFFMHKENDTWNVTESRSGRRVASGNTRAECVSILEGEKLYQDLKSVNLESMEKNRLSLPLDRTITAA